MASSARPARALARCTPIRVSKPGEVIAARLQELIVAEVLRPGDRLPPERALAERFGVGRGHVREALKRLEFYGILHTRPQSGTVVASRGARRSRASSGEGRGRGPQPGPALPVPAAHARPHHILAGRQRLWRRSSSSAAGGAPGGVRRDPPAGSGGGRRRHAGAHAQLAEAAPAPETNHTEETAMRMTRRTFLTTGMAATTLAAAPRAFAQWQPSLRYPDPAVQIVDPSFARYRLGAHQGRAAGHGLPLVGGAGVVRRRALPAVERHPEQPHHALGRGDRPPSPCFASRRTSPTATRATARAASSPASTARRRVSRTEYDGTITTIADRCEGKPLNSPNDIVCKSDGSIWFTDPALRHPRLLRGLHRQARAADQRLPGGRQDRSADRGRRRHQPPQRPGVLARRVEALRRRGRRHAAPHPRLRRRRRRHPHREQAHADRRGPRHARRLPLRRRRQPLVRLGHGRGGARRRRRSSTRTASSSAASTCPSAAPTSASAAPTAIDCSWWRARRSTRST